MMKFFLICFYLCALFIYVVHSQGTCRSATEDVMIRNRAVEVEPAVPLHRKVYRKVCNSIKDLRAKQKSNSNNAHRENNDVNSRK